MAAGPAQDLMIDLGEVQRERPAPIPGVRPPVPWRTLLGALSVVLLALLAGGAPLATTRRPVIIPGHLADIEINERTVDLQRWIEHVQI